MTMHVTFERMEEIPIAVLIGYTLFFLFTTALFDSTSGTKDRTCMTTVVHFASGVLLIAQLAVLSMFFFAQLPTTRQIHLW